MEQAKALLSPLRSALQWAHVAASAEQETNCSHMSPDGVYEQLECSNVHCRWNKLWRVVSLAMLGSGQSGCLCVFWVYPYRVGNRASSHRA